MSVGPMSGVVGSAAGAPLSQTAGSETERAQKDSSAQERQVEKDKKAADAAGIGQTEEDQGASERDADGRRFWEANQEKDPDQPAEPSEPTRQAKDPTGSSGTSLDLTG
jgi:hypothetical protein